MKRLSIWRLAVLGVLVAAVVASSAVPSDAAGSSAASEPLAVWQAGFAYTLGRVDPATLLPAGRQVPLLQAGTPVLSPGRSWVAFGSDTVASVSVASAVPLRKPARSSIVLSRHLRGVVALAWPRPHRLLALAGGGQFGLFCCRKLRLYVVDPLKRRVLRTVRLSRGYVIATESTRTGLAILLGGRGRLAPARLLLVTRSGATHTVTLARFKVGFVGHFVTTAALVVGQRSAYVLCGGSTAATVAVVPLARGPAAYHTVPAGPALVSPDRGLVLLPGGRLGAAGPTGLYVYDARSWRQVGSVPFRGQIGYISGGSMIALDGGRGVDVYNLDGSLRYHRNTPDQVGNALFVGGRAFLFYQQGDYQGDWGVLDLDSGTLHPPIVGNNPVLIPGQPDVPAFASTPF